MDAAFHLQFEKDAEAMERISDLLDDPLRGELLDAAFDDLFRSVSLNFFFIKVIRAYKINLLYGR